MISHNLFCYFIKNSAHQTICQTLCQTPCTPYAKPQARVEYLRVSCAFIRHMSRPSSSHPNCLWSICITSRTLSGQVNLCFSSRFCHRQNPFLSQYKTLIMFRVRLQKTKRCPDRGFISKCSCTRMDRPLMDFLISVHPQHRYTGFPSKRITVTSVYGRPSPVVLDLFFRLRLRGIHLHRLSGHFLQ